MPKVTMKQIRSIKAGQWIRIRYDDVGIQDALVVEPLADNKWLDIFTPYADGTDRIDPDQIVSISNIFLSPPKY